MDAVLAEDGVAVGNITCTALRRAIVDCQTGVPGRAIGGEGTAGSACRTGLTDEELTTPGGLLGHRSEGRKWVAWC